MCGIWGMISQGEFDTPTVLAVALRYIGGRGPDARGVKSGAGCGHAVIFAHSRLAIIDLSARGAQPMVDAESGWWVVFNGEIYNYLEIRKELRDAGQIFCGDSDTEVLLRAWVRWGPGALQRLNGMFAFAAFNPLSGEVWLVRDRFGVKPLAWGYCPNELIDACRALFDSAVRLRLRSDVPVAVSLSAGLDSAAIACVMRRDLPHTQAFSFGSPLARASEGLATAALSATAGIAVTYVWPQLGPQGLSDMVETTMAFQEAPFSGLSPIAQNLVFRAVSGANRDALLSNAALAQHPNLLDEALLLAWLVDPTRAPPQGVLS